MNRHFFSARSCTWAVILLNFSGFLLFGVSEVISNKESHGSVEVDKGLEVFGTDKVLAAPSDGNDFVSTTIEYKAQGHRLETTDSTKTLDPIPKPEAANEVDKQSYEMDTRLNSDQLEAESSENTFSTITFPTPSTDFENTSKRSVSPLKSIHMMEERQSPTPFIKHIAAEHRTTLKEIKELSESSISAKPVKLNSVDTRAETPVVVSEEPFTILSPVLVDGIKTKQSVKNSMSSATSSSMASVDFTLQSRSDSASNSPALSAPSEKMDSDLQNYNIGSTKSYNDKSKPHKDLPSIAKVGLGIPKDSFMASTLLYATAKADIEKYKNSVELQKFLIDDVEAMTGSAGKILVDSTIIPEVSTRQLQRAYKAKNFGKDLEEYPINKTLFRSVLEGKAETSELERTDFNLYKKEISSTKKEEYLSQLKICSKNSPVYKQIKNNNSSYETRLYPASSWLSVNVMTNNRILAELEATDKLRKYFEGHNEKGFRLNLTCPVLTQIKFKGLSNAREKITEYAVSFYLPWNEDNYIPSPDDSEILVDIDEERTVFVQSFRARVWEMTDIFLQTEIKKLFAALRNKGEAFLSDYFYLASYINNPVTASYADYELWAYATRSQVHRDVEKVKPSISVEPLNEVTRRTRSRVCKGLECPRFDVLSVHKNGIQKRRYFGARFATYHPDFCSFTKGNIWRAFMPLHLYKHGVNSNFEIIGATRPAGILHVTEKTGHLADSSCNQTFSVSLYLPKRFHAVPPTAGLTMPQIKISELDDVLVYVQSVGGFLLSPERIYKEINLFRQRLKQQDLCFKNNEYYLVVYDYITRFHGRLNEIWIIAEMCSNTL